MIGCNVSGMSLKRKRLRDTLRTRYGGLGDLGVRSRGQAGRQARPSNLATRIIARLINGACSLYVSYRIGRREMRRSALSSLFTRLSGSASLLFALSIRLHPLAVAGRSPTSIFNGQTRGEGLKNYRHRERGARGGQDGNSSNDLSMWPFQGSRSCSSKNAGDFILDCVLLD